MASPVDYLAFFEQTPDNYLLLAPDPPRFTMIAASETRLRETMTRREDLIGRPLFEVFPDNPHDPGATGVRNLAASLHRVIHSGTADRMPLQRYDIRTPEGEFVERYWEPSNVPVFDEGGELIYIIHRAEDVTERVRAESALREIEERERLLTEEAERARGEAERRAEKEMALHDLAHALSAAVSVREVVQIVVDEAVELTRAFGAYVERLEVPEPGSEVEVVAISGAGVPPLGTRVPYPGSLTEEIIEAGKPEIMTEVGAIGESMAPYLARSCRLCSGLVVPLSSEQRPLGALVLLRGPEQDQFTEAEALFARALGDASSVALRRALLVEEINRDRRERMALLESTGEGVCAIDNEGRVTILNRAGAEILGYTPEEVLGKRMHDLIHHSRPDGSPYPFEECPIIRTIRVGEGVRVDSEELWRRDGSSFPAEYSAYPIVEDDDVTGAVITFTDITERKRAEEAQSLLAEAGAVLATSLDYEGTLARVARLAVPALADYCMVDIVEEDDEVRRLAAVHRDPVMEDLMRSSRRFPPPPQSPITRSLRSGEPVLISELTEREIEELAGSEEHRQQIRANGARSLMIVPLVARGRTLGVITFAAAESGRRYDQEDLVIAQELTGRAALAMDNAGLFQRVEEARGEAERRAREERALREAAEAVTASFTEEEIIQQIARSALTATNADCTVVERIDIARGEVKIVAVAGDKMIPLGERVDYSGSLAEQVVERKESVHIPVVSEAHDRISPHLLSACSDCSALAVPLLDAGEAIGALILLREPEKWRFRPDEAERARTFANLAALAFRKVHLLEDSERKREELAQVMESRARLMRGFSHDVKNPLGAADGFLQLLEEGIMDHLTPRQEESVGRARSSLSSALRLIEDLLELARAEAGEITVEWTSVDTWEATREVAESYRAQAEGKGLSFQVELPDETPVIRSDSDRIRQILGNLLSNAVKYTERGGIRVRLSVREGDKAPGPGRWLAIDIADTGPGISADQQKHLFKEFRRLEATNDAAGMGIGLAISRRITHALDAELTVESEVGKGSTFTLWLPLEYD